LLALKMVDVDGYQIKTANGKAEHPCIMKLMDSKSHETKKYENELRDFEHFCSLISSKLMSKSNFPLPIIHHPSACNLPVPTFYF
jgi:HD-like signal output (HDOD) protein